MNNWTVGAGALGQPRGMVWWGRKEEGSGWGTHVYLWQIHCDIWQNQYNIVMLNKIKLKKRKKNFPKEPSTLQSKALTGSSYPKTLWVFAQRCLPFLPILNNYKMILHRSYSSPGFKRPFLNPNFKILTSQNLPFPQIYIIYNSWKMKK